MVTSDRRFSANRTRTAHAHLGRDVGADRPLAERGGLARLGLGQVGVLEERRKVLAGALRLDRGWEWRRRHAWQPSQAEESRMEVDELGKCRGVLADRVGQPGGADDQREPGGKLVLGLFVPEPVLAELPAVVSVHHHTVLPARPSVSSSSSSAPT